MDSLKKNLLWNKDYILLLIVNTVAYLSFQILAPLMPVYGLLFSSSESQIGFLASAVAVAALAIRPFSGPLADRRNCKYIILGAQLGTAVVILVFIFASNIIVLIATRFIHGLLFGLGSTAVTASAIRTIPEDQIGRGIGILSATGIGSLAVAPALGIFISETWGYSVLFVFTAIVAVAAGIIVLVVGSETMLPAVGKGLERFKFSLKELFAVEALGFMGITIIFTSSTAMITSFLVVFANTRNIANIGLYFTIYAIVLILVRVIGSRIIDKYSYKRTIPICAALCACGLVIIGASTTFPPLCIAALVLGIGYGISSPTLQTQAIKSVPAERRGTAAATFYCGMDMSHIGGPLAMGFIAEASEYSTGFFCFFLLMLAAIPLTFLLKNRR